MNEKQKVPIKKIPCIIFGIIILLASLLVVVLACNFGCSKRDLYKLLPFAILPGIIFISLGFVKSRVIWYLFLVIFVVLLIIAGNIF